MMKPKYTVLSVTIAAILAGCSGPATEKPAATTPMDSTGAALETESAVSTAPVAAAIEEAEAAAASQAGMAPMAVVPEAEPATVVVDSKPIEAEELVPAFKAEAAPAPAPKRELKIPTSPNTFLITADTKTQAHPNFGMGQSVGFLANGKEGGEIAVTRSSTYTFIVDTGVQHDFYLTTNAAGWGAGTYTDGVEGQFIYEGEVTFKPDVNTPDLLYYQCRNHKYMGGKIYVLDKGEDLAKAKAAVMAAGGDQEAATRRTGIVVSESSVKQKLSYAKMVLTSGSAKRVEQSGHPEANKMLNDARAQIDAANNAYESGNYEQSMSQVNEGLRLLTAASRLITTESEMSGINYKAKYDELSSSLQTYEKSYKRHLERAEEMKQTPKSKLDEAEYNRLVSSGRLMADKEDFSGASKSLEKAQAMITAVLTDMLHQQTVTYDKKFATPKEEYEYELARLESYEELIPLAIEQKQPSERALELIDDFVQKAAKIKAEGQEIAAKGDYKMAIMAMEAATSNLQRALRMAGVN